MKIWPTAPQAAKLKTAVPTEGLRRMKAVAAENSLAAAGVRPMRGASGVESRYGERSMYATVRRVERRFCATII